MTRPVKAKLQVSWKNNEGKKRGIKEEEESTPTFEWIPIVSPAHGHDDVYTTENKVEERRTVYP